MRSRGRRRSGEILRRRFRTVLCAWFTYCLARPCTRTSSYVRAPWPPQIHQGWLVEFLVNWEVRRRDVLSRPKYIPDKAPVRVWIISLARTPARKLATVRSLKKYGISFGVYDAVDGLNELNQSEVLRYAGNKKQQRMGLTWSTQTMQLHEYTC